MGCVNMTLDFLNHSKWGHLNHRPSLIFFFLPPSSGCCVKPDIVLLLMA
jgi:hypothetical protein